MGKVNIGRETIDQAMENTAVRQALRRRAELLLPRTQQQAAKAGRGQLAKRLKVEHGVRPGTKAVGGIKRPYARVTAEYPEEARKADAGARLTARLILRRASRG